MLGAQAFRVGIRQRGSSVGERRGALVTRGTVEMSWGFSSAIVRVVDRIGVVRPSYGGGLLFECRRCSGSWPGVLVGIAIASAPVGGFHGGEGTMRAEERRARE